jgi:hypothetical protein
VTVAERPLSQGSGGEPEQAVTSAPRISWPEFQAYLSDHWVPKSTPHVSIISQNGGGKTYLVGRGLLPMLDDERVLFVDTKHDDDEINRIGMFRVKKVPTRMERRLHYRHKKPRDQWFQLMVTTRDQVAAAIRTCVAEGGWVIVLDEERSITDKTPYYNLGGLVAGIRLRGRSRGITLIGLTQAPFYVNESFYNQAHHLFIGSLLDVRAKRRLGEIGGDTTEIMAIVSQLRLHEFLYIGPLNDTGRRTMFIVKVP